MAGSRCLVLLAGVESIATCLYSLVAASMFSCSVKSACGLQGTAQSEVRAVVEANVLRSNA